MRRNSFVWIAAVFCSTATLLSLRLAASPGQEPSQLPRFQASVELTSLDVSVIGHDGRPIRNLGPEAFVVRVDGKMRRVVSANWVSLVGGSTERPAVPVPE